MPRTLALLPAALLCFASACATTAPQGTTGAVAVNKAKDPGKEPAYICERYRPTGSNIMEEICRPVDQVERERQQAQEFMRTPPTAKPPVPPGGK
jgi:hypothetical protein